jgi:hypothetical protein
MSCCDDMVDRIENVLHYNCFKGCLFSGKMGEQAKLNQDHH